MAFRFKRREEFSRGFSRICAEQVERALREWDNPDRPVAVHETRKCMKRLRALLRLARPSIAVEAFRQENASLREIAAALSTSRDLQVMTETVSRLEEFSNAEELRLLAKLMTRINRDIADLEASKFADAKLTKMAMRTAGKRLAKLKLMATGYEVVAPGLKQTYSQGRKRLQELIAVHSDEASHDLRKRVQAHWRQMALLSAAWPEYFEARIALARQLSEGLGNDHDLAVLRDYASSIPPKFLQPGEFDTIAALISARQDALRAQAICDGKLLFAEPAKAIANQIGSYWKVADEQPKSVSLSSRKHMRIRAGTGK